MEAEFLHKAQRGLGVFGYYYKQNIIEKTSLLIKHKVGVNTVI